MTVAAAAPATTRASFERRFAALSAIGHDPVTGTWNRLSWTPADIEARAWLVAEATALGLAVEVDAHGNLWAWWGDPDGTDAIATGSHLDTVPGGGAYDGALGVVSALGAVEILRDAGFRPARPLAVVAFTEEEGARFGQATLGSRLAAGLADPAAALDRVDADGVTLAAAMRAAGHDPDAPDRPTPCARLAAFVELHVEQGRHLVHLGEPIGIATAIIPHGRWRLTATGEGNHAGTTRLEDRHDPMQVLAEAITSARRHAHLERAVATVGRVEVLPNGANVIPTVARAWLDARAADDGSLRALVRGWSRDMTIAGATHHCTVSIDEESRTPAVHFDPDLAARIRRALGDEGDRLPAIPTGAGHDAGILAGTCPTAMLFVRNPSGVSHAAAESATLADCVAGTEALAAVLRELLSQVSVPA